MAMTLADFRTEVRFNIKRDSNGFADSLIDRRVNWALDAIGQFYTFEEMRKEYTFAVSITEYYYAFPTGMKDIYSIWVDNGSGVKLTYRDPREFDEHVTDHTTIGTGDPTDYVDYGTRFMLYPLSGTAYTSHIKCSIFSPYLTLATDTPLFLHKDKLITTTATAFCFESLKEDDLASYWRKVAQDDMQRAVAGDHNAEDWVPVARPFVPTRAAAVGQPWSNPFVMRT